MPIDRWTADSGVVRVRWTALGRDRRSGGVGAATVALTDAFALPAPR
ncbi:hypothetical protein [Natronorubrum halophilum]|nr:hypothetical protein [Natronorubrum halophilum]